MNIRKDIRYKIASKFTGTVMFKGVAVRVVANKVDPFFEKDLPVISVYTFDEDADDKRTAPRRYYRTLNIAIQLILEAETGRILDDDLDDISVIMEKILFKDQTLDQIVDDSRLTKTNIAMKDDAERTIGSLIVLFQAEYQDDSVVLATDAEQLDNFETANTDIEINKSGNTDMQSTQPIVHDEPPIEEEPSA